jgi:hypothetical protein
MAKASSAYGAHTKDRADFWRVSVRTMQKWRCVPAPAGAPPAHAIEDPAAMLAWAGGLPAASYSKLTRTFRRRLDELRVAAATGRPPPTGSRPAPGAPDDPDRAAFLAARAAAATPSAAGAPAPNTTYLRDLIQERDFAIFKLQRANTTNNLPVIKDTTEAITRLSGVIHDEELRAQRLGREIGDIIPRADYERQLRALAYWLVRCVDDAKAALAPRLAAASATGPLFRQEVDALLEPVLLTTRVLEPLRRSTDLPAGTGAALPPWALAAMRAALAAALESPEAIHPEQGEAAPKGAA